jgi:hypothetical protein
MKIKIDTGGPYDADTVYLRLIETDPNHVMLEAVYDYGGMQSDEDIFLPGGGLLTITADGRVSLSPKIDPALGFELDHDGRLKLDEYTEAQTARRGAFRRGRARLALDNTKPT